MLGLLVPLQVKVKSWIGYPGAPPIHPKRMGPIFRDAVNTIVHASSKLNYCRKNPLKPPSKLFKPYKSGTF